MPKKTYKSKSGKHGSIYEVVSDKDYGKDTRGEAKDKVYMNTTKGADKGKGKIIAPDLAMGEKIKQLEDTLSGVDSHPDVVSANEHNNNINVIPDIYGSKLSLSPGSILVRLYKIVPVENGFYVGYPQLKMPSRATGDPGLGNETQVHPFPFKTIGIIHNISNSVKTHMSDKNGDNYWPGFEVGAKVIIDSSVLKVDFNPDIWKIVPPVYKFVHPEDKEHQDGYVLIRSNHIKAIIN